MKTIRIYESTYDLGTAKKNHMSSIVERDFVAENKAETVECNSATLNKKKGISTVEDAVDNGAGSKAQFCINDFERYIAPGFDIDNSSAGSKGHFFISEEC